MNIEHLIGSRQVRTVTVMLAVGSLGLVGLVLAGIAPAWGGALRFTMWAGLFLTLVAGVHWSQRIYQNWMKGAAAVNVVMTTILFGACYLLIVPVFWAIFKVKARRLAGTETNWHDRRPVDPDLQYFQRMG